MRSRLFLTVLGTLSLLLLLVGNKGNAYAQEHATSAQQVLDNLQMAISGGDAAPMLAPAADRLAITLFGASKYYSRDQAKYVLEDFFRTYPPVGFTFGTPRTKEGHVFASGVYRVEQGDAPLYVYVRMQQHANMWQLREIRIQRQAFR